MDTLREVISAGFTVKMGGGSQRTGGGSRVCKGVEVGDGNRMKRPVWLG